MARLPIKYSIAVRSTKPGTKKEDITETRAYPVIQLNGLYGVSDLAEHIAAHGSKYSRGDIYAVLAEAVDCTREMLTQGLRVTLGDLGTFTPTLKGTGATTSSECTSANIKDVRVKFQPARFLKNLKDDATFECVPSRKGQKDALTAERAKETLQPEPGNEGSGGNSID